MQRHLDLVVDEGVYDRLVAYAWTNWVNQGDETCEAIRNKVGFNANTDRHALDAHILGLFITGLIESHE